MFFINLNRYKFYSWQYFLTKLKNTAFLFLNIILKAIIYTNFLYFNLIFFVILRPIITSLPYLNLTTIIGIYNGVI